MRHSIHLLSFPLRLILSGGLVISFTALGSSTCATQATHAPPSPKAPKAPSPPVSVARIGDTLIVMRDFEAGTIRSITFRLSSRADVDIHGVGARGWVKSLAAYGWILDATTREMVWAMSQDNCSEFQRDEKLCESEERLTLPTGDYIAYYYCPEGMNLDGNLNINIDEGDWREFRIFMEKVGRELKEAGEKLRDAFADDDDTGETDNGPDHPGHPDPPHPPDQPIPPEESDGGFSFSDGDDYSAVFSELDDETLTRLRLEIAIPRQSYRSFAPTPQSDARTVVELTKPGDDQRINKGFTLSRPTTLALRAIGEYEDGYGLFVDKAWIVDADTRATVWEMDKWNADYAGGARKNRIAKETVTLPSGNYLAFYATDGSHAFGNWNSPPPYDPDSYGFVVLAQEKADLAAVTPYVDQSERNVILCIDHAGNNFSGSQAFAVARPISVRVVCLGECSWESFADNGWIENSETGEPVLTLTEENTMHAGGAHKNRLFDGVVQLAPGAYVAGYSTDDSHAYGDWNAPAPLDPEKWGLCMYGMGKSFDKTAVSLLKETDLVGTAIASLTRLDDDEHASRRFTLSTSTTVRIVALGEGTDGDMYDYGWIEDADTGRKVWVMRFRDTRPGGGAEKNRMIDRTITLPAGEYEAVFVTDGSHSYEGFNASQPRNPQRWGMTVSKGKDSQGRR